MFGLIVCTTLLGASPLLASGINPLFTPCATATLNNLISPGAGCTLGGSFSVDNFGFSASTGAPLTSSDITVTPTVRIVSGQVASVDLNFSGNFNNASGLTAEQYTFDYNLDPPLPLILGAGIALAPGATLTEDICVGGLFSGSSCSGTAFTLTVPGSLLFPTGVSLVDYHIVLNLPAGNTTAGFDSSSVTGSATPTPEPSSILLFATGLVALWSFRRRQHHSSHVHLALR